MRNVHLVHALHGVIDNKPGKLFCYRQMEREKQRKCSRIEVACTEHRARIAAFASGSVHGLKHGLDRPIGPLRQSEGWDKGLVGRKPDE